MINDIAQCSIIMLLSYFIWCALALLHFWKNVLFVCDIRLWWSLPIVFMWCYVSTQDQSSGNQSLMLYVCVCNVYIYSYKRINCTVQQIFTVVQKNCWTMSIRGYLWASKDPSQPGWSGGIHNLQLHSNAVKVGWLWQRWMDHGWLQALVWSACAGGPAGQADLWCFRIGDGSLTSLIRTKVVALCRLN